MIMLRRLNLLCATAALAFYALASHEAYAQFRLEPAFPDESVAGPAVAKGAVIWSHGRSVTVEDSLSPTPPYVSTLLQAGWDTYRFNRLRVADTLPESARELIAQV